MGNTRADDTVPHFTSVEEIANSNTDRFLIGGTKKINGLQILDASVTPIKQEQRNFLPGDVLTKEKIYYGETKKRTRLFRKSKYITEKFLLCRDDSDREILLPFEQAGIFYQVSHKYGKAQKNVLQMSDIVARKLTPRIIKLVYGRFPITPSEFTGLMKAESSKIETSIIASTLINTRNILMEIPLCSSIRFRVAITDNDLRRNPCYRNAMSLCAERAITYMRNIKVCYNLTGEDDEEIDTFDVSSVSEISTLERSDSLRRPMKSDLRATKSIGPGDFGHYSLRRGFSMESGESVVVRPARSASTSRMSFCLGNSYLTVPLGESANAGKRNSGNNNTVSEAVFTTNGGSRLSFNGKFVEEETENDESASNSNEHVSTLQPLRIDAEIHRFPTQQDDEEDENYVSVSQHRRPSTRPPDTLPPPLPTSTSTSGVSSGSVSPTVECASSRGSGDSFEYAVPKTEDRKRVCALSNDTDKFEEPRTVETSTDKASAARRPSTFTFTEQCHSKQTRKVSTIKEVEHVEEGTTSLDDSSPVYENIKSLMEMVAQLKTMDGYSSDEDDDGDEENKDAMKGGTLTRSECNIESMLDVEGQSKTSTLSDNAIPVKEHFNQEACLENSKNTDELLIAPPDTLNEDDLVIKANFEQSQSVVCNSEHTTECEEDATNQNITKVQSTCSLSDNNVSLNVNTDNISTSAERTEKVESEPLKAENKSLATETEAETPIGGSEETKQYEQVVECMDFIRAQIEQTNENCSNSENELVDPVTNDIGGGSTDPNHTTDVDERTTSDDDHICIFEQHNVKPSDALNCWRKAEGSTISEHETAAKAHTPQRSRRNTGSANKTLPELTIEDIAKRLRDIGVKEASIQQVTDMGVDGRRFQEVLDGTLNIRDCLGPVNLIDQQKISMFIRGWMLDG